MIRCTLRHWRCIKAFIIVQLVAVLVTIIGCSMVFAEPSGQSKMAMEDGRKVVRVGYQISESYQEGNISGKPKTGWGYDYLQAIAVRTGWKYVCVYGTFDTLLQKLANGEIDLMGNIAYNPERAKLFDFGFYEEGREEYFIYARDEDTVGINDTMRFLSGKTYGITKDPLQVEAFKNWANRLGLAYNLVEYDNPTARITDMRDHKIDFTVSLYVRRHNELTKNWTPIQRITEVPFYFCVNKRRPDLLRDLNDAQRRILATDPLFNSKNYNKYVGASTGFGTHISLEEQHRLSKTSSLRVGVLKDAAPYVLVRSNDELGGIMGVIGKHFSDNFNISVSCEQYSDIQELKDALLKGEVDVIFPVVGSMWLGEMNDISVSAPIQESSMMLLYSGEYRDNLMKKIAVPKSSPFAMAYAKLFLTDAEVVEYPTVDDCINAVADAKVDSTIFNHNSYQVYKRHNTMARQLSTLDLPNALETCVAVRRGDSALLSLLDKSINNISDAEIQEALSSATDANIDYTLSEDIERNAIPLTIAFCFLIALLAFGFYGYYKISNQNAKILLSAKQKAEEALQQEKNMRLELETAKNKADHDPMTGLLNKGAFEMFTGAFENADVDYVMIIIDVDNFKHVNDTYGHQMGDKVLKKLAGLMYATFRPSDFLARIGGDEFSIIMINMGIKYKKVIETKLDFLNDSMKDTADGSPKVSLSMGVAFSNGKSEEDFSAVFKRADNALYIVKENGRDGVGFSD